MGNVPLLDLVIGLSFVYLLLALMCTTVTEWIAHFRGSRGRMLVQGVRSMVGESDPARATVTDAVFRHPLIAGLKSDGKPPSYLASDVFAKALLQSLRSSARTDGDSASPSVTPTPHLREALSALAASEPVADDPPNRRPDNLPSEAIIATWFDAAMARLSGVYKRRSRVVVFWVAAGLTILLNADSVALSGALWKNASLRSYLVERAKVRLAQGPPLETVEYTDPDSDVVTAPIEPRQARGSGDRLLDEEIDVIGELFGWKGGLTGFFDRGTVAVIWSMIGWVITTLAISLGAPFWFDTLNRFMNIRAAGAVPAPAKREEKKP